MSACVSAAALLVREGYSVTVLDGDGAHLAEPLDGGDLAAVEQLAIDLSVLRARPGGSLSALVSMFTGASTGPPTRSPPRTSTPGSTGPSRRTGAGTPT